MSRIEVRDLAEPEAVVDYPLGATFQVRLAETVISRHVLAPGWNWEEHARPMVGTPSCELYHRGVVLSGQMGVRTDEGEELIIGPNHVFDLPPGHVTWVEGDEELVMVDWAGGAGFDAPPGREARVMATILFTDIVDSTATAQRLGDSRWFELVAAHNERIQFVLNRYSGRLIKTTGDGILAIFDGAERAVRAATALHRELAALDLKLRAGIHSGEVELVPGDIRGVAVHAAARQMALAGAGETLISGTTRELLDVTGLEFEDRGAYEFKGLSGKRSVFALTGEPSATNTEG